MSKMVEMSEAEAAEFAYGMLWHASIDRHTLNGRILSDARTALGNVIGKERKGRGIEAAKAWMREHPVSVRSRSSQGMLDNCCPLEIDGCPGGCGNYGCGN